MKKLLALSVVVMLVGCSWHDNVYWKGTMLDFRSEEEKRAYEEQEKRRAEEYWASRARGEEPQIAARDDYPLKRNYGIKRITDNPLRIDDFWIPRLPFSAPLHDQQKKLDPLLDRVAPLPRYPTFPVFPR